MKLSKLIVTFFFIGQAKIAPGSIASLFTTLLFYMFAMNLDFIIFVHLFYGLTFINLKKLIQTLEIRKSKRF